MTFLGTSQEKGLRVFQEAFKGCPDKGMQWSGLGYSDLGLAVVAGVVKDLHGDGVVGCVGYWQYVWQKGYAPT